jgi:hypothetical protein
LVYPKVADLEPEGTLENSLRVQPIKDRIPESTIVPADDQRGFSDLERFPQNGPRSEEKPRKPLS